MVKSTILGILTGGITLAGWAYLGGGGLFGIPIAFTVGVTTRWVAKNHIFHEGEFKKRASVM